MNIIYALPYCHLPYKPKNSVPDAESQRQHDSWPTQWSLFEFPGKDSHCQEAKYDTHDFSYHHLFTSSLNPFPHLKNGNFFGLISTVSPVLGFLPVYPSYVLTQKEHRPRISTRSPFSSAVAIWLKNMDTILVASILIRPFVVLRVWMRSILFMGFLSLVIAVGWINKISINLQQYDRICQTHVVICVQTLYRRGTLK